MTRKGRRIVLYGSPDTRPNPTQWIVSAVVRYSPDHHAVSIYGNVQPEIYKRELRRLAEDGAMQRFIPVMVDPELTRMPALSDRLVPAAMEYDLMLRRTRTLPITTYYLSDAAREQWTMFVQWYYQFRRDERMVKADSIYMTALGKLEGTVGRIAALLAYHGRSV